MQTKGAMQAPTVGALGMRFAEQREALGLSRAEVAIAADYSSEQVRRVELGHKLPGAELLAALMRLGGDVVYVLGGVAADRDKANSDDDFLTARDAALEREEVRRMAREYRQSKSDERRRLLTDQEVSLIDAWRELNAGQRKKVLQFLLLQRPHADLGYLPHPEAVAPSPSVVVTGDGNQVAGGSIHAGPKTTKRK